MKDNPYLRNFDTVVMRACHSSVEGLSKDIGGLAVRIRGANLNLSTDLCTTLVNDFIRSSRAVNDFAKAEKLSGRTGRSIWHYHFSGLKQYQQKLAFEIHQEKPELSCDDAWYSAQDKIAEMIAGNSYEKVDDAESIL